MIRAAETPWEAYSCPLFCHQPRNENSEEMGKNFLPPLLSDLKSNPEFAFLLEKPEFQKLFAAYRAEINK